MLIGYARVSTDDQSLDLQLDALNQAGCKRVFTDKASGTQKNRPGLTEALSHLREGDVLVIYSDGVAEAGAMRDDMFGEDRLTKVIADNRSDSATAVEAAICEAVETFMGGDPFDDDLTLVVVKCQMTNDK